MADHDAGHPWDRPGWLAEAQAWITTVVEARGLTITGSLEQPHVRPWSTVLYVPTSVGPHYFKAVAPALAHEPALTEMLGHWQPGRTVQPLAVDRERGWMLLPDGGVQLREVMRQVRGLEHWEVLLPAYAELQQALVSHLPATLGIGTPDRRLATLPAQYEHLLNDGDAVGLGLPEGLTVDEHQRLFALALQLATSCAELASYAVPESLHHGDLHDGNIVVRGGTYRFFDWGDSCAAHPFFSLRTAFVSIEHTLGLDEGDPAFARLRDAYLEPWTGRETRLRLQQAFSLAQPLAALCGALTWHRTLATLALPQRQEYRHVVPSLLREYAAGLHDRP